MRVSPTSTSNRRGLLLVLIALVAIAIPAGVLAAKPVTQPTTFQLLNVSDWHGNLDPVTAAAGGAWNISARWKEDRKAYPSLSLTAGDDFGAAPPLSGFFDEVPAVKAERLMGIQVNTFGNHDFDRGITHLQQMIDLAAAPTDGGHPGKPFPYVAANLQNISANLTGVEPFVMLKVGKVKVAIIGIVNEEAPTLVSPGNFGTMQVTDGVAAATKWAQKARQTNANVVIVITHKGMDSVSPANGPLKTFAEALPAGLVDVVVGDHTNIQYSATAPNGVLYHENLSYGNGYAKTLITATDGKGGHVTAKSVSFVTPVPGTLSDNNTSCGTITYCDQAIVDMLIPYRTALAAALDGKIGTTTIPFDRGGNIERRQEVPLGDLIADSMRSTYGTDFAYIGGGGLRQQFPTCTYQPVDHTLNRANYASNHSTIAGCSGYAYTPGTPLDLVKGDVYAVLPFGNNIVTRPISGHQIWQMMENGVSKCPSPLTSADTCQGRFAQVSGLKYSFKVSNPSGCSGSEVPPITWTCVTGATHRVQSVTRTDGTPIPDDATTFTMSLPDFTNTGGDSFFFLNDGQGVSRDRDANVLLNYLLTNGADLDPASYPLDRITALP